MKRLMRIAGRGLVVAIFVLSITFLARTFQQFDVETLTSYWRQLSWQQMLLAVGWMVVNYLVLVGYDQLALWAIGRELPLGRVALGSFTGFTAGYNLGPLLGGGLVRLRLYTSWGFSSLEIVQLGAMMAITFWMGLLFLAGVVFVWCPQVPPGWSELTSTGLQWLGASLLGLTLAYVVLTRRRQNPFRIRGVAIPFPDTRITLLQLLVSAFDFLIAAACLHALVGPATSLGYLEMVAVMLSAMVVGVASQVPGGVGVFEAVIVQSSGPSNPASLLSGLVLFRMIYFLLPFCAALLLLMAYEASAHTERLIRWTNELAKWSGRIAPRFIAGSTFLAGVVLLFSGARAPLASRMQFLESALPLSVIEASHFLASMIGAALLLIAIGLNRRLDTAWWLAMVLTVIGMIASLLKGFDYEEAIILAVIVTILYSSRRTFYRRGSLVNQSLSKDSMAAIGIVMACSLLLAAYTNKNVEMSSTLWWDFSYQGDASRIFRGLVGALCVIILFAVRQLMRPKMPDAKLSTADDFQRATQIVRNSRESSAQLATLGDKYFQFNSAGTGFVMYAVQGRSWIAMRDPVGPPTATRDLAWSFHELADKHNGWPVFYQVGSAHLSTYLDQGLTLLKLGEEARVPLPNFGLEGSARRGLRQTFNRLHRENCSFEVVSGPALRALLPELRQVSDAWLVEKQTKEKGFSLGFFHEPYVSQFPCGIVRRGHEILGFTNLWCSSDREEIANDLMRFRPDAPASLMEYLLIESMLWGREQGYQWFSLGMAPLSGIDDRPLAPFWNRAVGTVFRHGNQLFSFEGLRKFKEKFDPVWSSRYLASPGGWPLARILADVALLISRCRVPSSLVTDFPSDLANSPHPYAADCDDDADEELILCGQTRSSAASFPVEFR
jgi:phosphatidylglycerol lysyltransferase